MDVSLSEMLAAVNGQRLDGCADWSGVEKVSTDTRTLSKGDLFFALSGPRFDGHDFISEASLRGATAFVISDTKKVSEIQKKLGFFIVVKDVLTAYGDLAKYWRTRFKVPVVAITGSSGKTTVKELSAHLLSAQKKVLKNRGTENNLVGVPKTLLQLDDTYEAVILEMGTNQPGEIERLSSIIAPQVAVVTLIGHSHLEGLKDLSGVKKEKLSLLKNLDRGGLLILNGEDPSLSDVRSSTHRVVHVGLKKEGMDHFADNIWCHEKGSSFHLDGKDLFESPLIGKHNIINALLALSVCAALGQNLEDARSALKDFRPVAGRLCVKDIAGIQWIDDTYNSNPSSFKAALETLKSLRTRGRKGVVFGDMLELGPAAEDLHREIGALLAEHHFDYVIGVGPLSQFAVDEALKKGYNPSKIFKVSDSLEAGKKCLKEVSQGDTVLVKGSRGMKMEKVIECFTTSSTP